MKYSINLLTTLLHIACSADSVRHSCRVAKTDYVTITPSQQSWNTLVSDSIAKYEKYRQYKGLYKLWETIHFRYRKGMRKQFARLHWECVEQQRAKESHERKDHEERMRKEKATAQYCAQLDALPHDKFMLSTVPFRHQAARKSTHAQIRTTAADRFTKNHTINLI